MCISTLLLLLAPESEKKTLSAKINEREQTERDFDNGYLASEDKK